MTSLIEMFKAMRNNKKQATPVVAHKPEYKFRDIPSLKDLSDEEAEVVGKAIYRIKHPVSMLDIIDL